jgi:alkylation response protein AidB-like acyl-CoA dehydrogenase
MDLSDSPAEATFRAEARAFLDAHHHEAPPDLEVQREEVWEDRLAALRAWQNLLYDNGWVAITWPEAHGGRGAGPVEQIIWNQECQRVRVPAPIGIVGIGMAGPAIFSHGSDAQRERHLSRILSGEELWCQLFSEPGAGSDLAALSTRAERDGDDWMVTGQKVWSSGAHFSQWGILLARTDSSVPKHEGLTFFLVDMSSPGVTVRPLRQMNGDVHFNEVFLDEVRIPDANRIGEPGEGWKVAMTTLMHERMTLGGSLGIFHWEELAELARRRGDLSPTERDQLARVYIDDKCLELLNFRILSKLAAGEIPTAEGAIAKLAMVRVLTRAGEAAFDLLGPAAVTEQSRWRNLFLITPGIRVGGGTDEVQKNMAAERVLGLPRELDETRTVPFNEIRRA